jgi:serine/threonine protein kinase
LNELDKAVLCDPGLFGISLTEGGYKIVGKKDTSDAGYLAPELHKEDQSGYPTRATDVYALGCLGFEVKLFSLHHAMDGLLNFSSSLTKEFIRLMRATHPCISPMMQAEWCQSGN